MDHPARRHALSESAAPLIPDGLDATLVLVRHGESELIAEGRFQGQLETPLSPIGRRQANLTAGRLARPHASPALPVPIGAPIELVYSPLRRTAETAKAIEAAMTTASVGPGAFRPDAGFAEIAQGQWEGLLATEVAARYQAELSAWRRQPAEAWAPGGESLAVVQARARPALSAMLRRLAEGRPAGSPDRSQVANFRDAPPEHPWSIVVAHDGVFKVTMLTLFDLPLDRFWMWSMDLCSIGVVELRAGRPVLRAHNLTAHLASLLDEAAQAETEERSRTGAL